MIEAQSFPRFGSAETTKDWFINFVDSRLPGNFKNAVRSERKFSITEKSDIILPAGELVVQRFVPTYDRNISLVGHDGSRLLGITHGSDFVSSVGLSDDEIDREFSVKINGNPLPSNTSKNRYVRHVLYLLTENEQSGGIVPYIDRSQGPRVTVPGA